jgi:hypothetical protein
VKLAVTGVIGVIPQPVAAAGPALIKVAKAVAVLPISTDRLDGSTAAASGTGGDEHAVKTPPLPQQIWKAVPSTALDGFPVAPPCGSINCCAWATVRPGLTSLTTSAKKTVEPKSGRCWMTPAPDAVASSIHSA